MNKLLHLIQFELWHMFGKLLVLSGLLALVETVLIHMMLFNPKHQYLRMCKCRKGLILKDGMGS